MHLAWDFSTVCILAVSCHMRKPAPNFEKKSPIPCMKFGELSNSLARSLPTLLRDQPTSSKC
ncbi:unnamed protein product [Larinioides sclopetarius]|uniref:Uncharacterized protein n=1 Tax=Larinioides sclopetarius TaxID=280406 RepID=A0AAV2A8J3_9ARAC